MNLQEAIEVIKNSGKTIKELMELEKNQPVMDVGARGTKRWYLDGKLHNPNGPAIEHPNGSKQYWVDGKLHNPNGPAVEHPNGSKQYLVDGKLHRTDGPALEYANGTKQYWVDGKFLFMIYSDGTFSSPSA